MLLLRTSKKYVEGDEIGMRSISIHLTDQCNNSCIFCVVNSHQKRKEGVNKKMIEAFLKENAGKGYESVNIHGGEATVLEDFIEVLRLIKQYGYPQISLQTNARKLADSNYAKEVYDNGVNLFVVSLHGKEAEEHDTITQVSGSFQEAVEGIKNVKKLGAKVRTNTVAYKGNIQSIPDIVELAINIGADHINLSAIHPVGKAYENFERVVPTYGQIQQKIFEAVDVCVKRNCVVTLEGFPNCMIQGYEKYQIDWEENEFKLLYHNFVLNNYATFMEKETKKRVPACRQCERKNICGGVYKEYLEFFGDAEFQVID